MSELARIARELSPEGFHVLVIHSSGKLFVDVSVQSKQELANLLPSLISAICKFGGEHLQGIGLLETSFHKAVLQKLGHLVWTVIGGKSVADEEYRSFLQQLLVAFRLMAEEKWGAIVKEEINLARALQTWSPAFIMDLFRELELHIEVARDIEKEVKDEEGDFAEMVLFFKGISQGFES